LDAIKKREDDQKAMLAAAEAANRPAPAAAEATEVTEEASSEVAPEATAEGETEA
jgi:small subunit ribosomal protein S16